MAMLQSSGHIMIFQATGDIPSTRSAVNLKIGSIEICGTSLTAVGQVKLVNGKSNLVVIPLTKFKSGAGVQQLHFDPRYAPQVVGLKATVCSNANIVVNLM